MIAKSAAESPSSGMGVLVTLFQCQAQRVIIYFGVSKSKRRNGDTTLFGCYVFAGLKSK